MLKSKKQGDIVEDALIEHLISIGLDAKKNLVHSLRYEYDVEVDLTFSSHGTAHKLGHRLTFECKNDVMASQTGNVAIEYHNSKKNEPSGISATKATFWVHKIDDDIWICSVDKLKQFIDTAVPVKKITSGGDKNANLYIYKIEDFTNQCKKLEEFKNEFDFYPVL